MDQPSLFNVMRNLNCPSLKAQKAKETFRILTDDDIDC